MHQKHQSRTIKTTISQQYTCFVFPFAKTRSVDVTSVDREDALLAFGLSPTVTLPCAFWHSMLLNPGHMQMSMRNGVTPKLKITLTLTLTDTEGAVLTLMLGYKSLYITWQQHHNCRIVCE